MRAPLIMIRRADPKTQFSQSCRRTFSPAPPAAGRAARSRQLMDSDHPLFGWPEL